MDSEELIELNAEGYATATRGAYKVIFNPNLNTMGAIDLLTPDHKRLRSHILGVYLTDSAAGKSLLVAGVKDSIGIILPPNQIIYPSAFDGLDADVRFTYRKGLFEADLILKENPALPQGFDPDTTRLELVTEFLDPPTPEVKQNVLQSGTGIDLVDDTLLDFGEMLMIPGKAFSINETGPASDAQRNSALHVLKQWRQINGRYLLIESVSWNEAVAHSTSLPKLATTKPRPARAARAERELPTKHLVSKDSKPVRVASLPYTETGFVIDFVITVTTQPTWTFLSGQTYLVANYVTISDSATFQAGAIIKFGRAGTLTLAGAVSCPSDGSVFLTARDDDSMGEGTSTGALTGYYGTYINLYYCSFAHYFREGFSN